MKDLTNLTYTQRQAVAANLRMRIAEICAAHPRTESEIEYLAELYMECQGCGEILRPQSKADAALQVILEYMEFTHPVSPCEFRALRALRDEPITIPEEA